MSLNQLSQDDQRKLKDFMDAGERELQEIADRKDALKDLTKNLAEHLDVKPAVLSKALSAAFKNSIEADKESFDDVETILQITGRI